MRELTSRLWQKLISIGLNQQYISTTYRPTGRTDFILAFRSSCKENSFSPPETDGDRVGSPSKTFSVCDSSIFETQDVLAIT